MLVAGSARLSWSRRCLEAGAVPEAASTTSRERSVECIPLCMPLCMGTPGRDALNGAMRTERLPTRGARFLCRRQGSEKEGRERRLGTCIRTLC